jgi:putative ABC transport system substrate-binding protein
MAPAQIKRRAFMSLIAGVAAWPVAARAQQSERVRRLGLLQGLAADDPEWQRRFGAFKQGLQDLGWTEGQNITFEGRFADGKPERLGALAAELVAANVDVIVTNAAQSIEAARKATSTIPIVMASVGDALGAGAGTGDEVAVACPAHWRANRCEPASRKRAGLLHHG